ncbi:MAG: hypothetical protein ACAH83_20480 [Alphaproteobacteria bacterium]
MPPFISPMFSYHSRRSNQFYDHELEEFLCPPPFKGEKPLAHALTLNSAHKVEAPGSSYTYSLEKSTDNKTIALEATLTRDGIVHKTAMTAVHVSENLYEITALTFDNKKERLDARWEISKVLSHIGKEQLQKACRDELPQPHEERGKFGKLARFVDRWLLPEDPVLIPPM